MLRDFELNVDTLKSSYKHAALKQIAADKYGVIPKAVENKAQLAQRIIDAHLIKAKISQRPQIQEATMDTIPAETNQAEIEAVKKINRQVKPPFRGNPEEMKSFMSKKYPHIKFVLNGDDTWHMSYKTTYKKQFKNKQTNEVKIKYYEHHREDSGNIHIPIIALDNAARVVSTLPHGSVITPYGE